jgi:hypothetical protein
MDALRQEPVFVFDHETRKQVRETRETILEHLRTAPDDFKALVLADMLGEIDPDRDATLAAHRMRFRATRPTDWKHKARELGLDRIVFHLAHGMSEARIGRDAVPLLERYATEISEARAANVEAGHIGASSVPDVLARDRRAKITYHPSGHLAKVAVYFDDLHHGSLELSEVPGSGRYQIIEKRGGYGTMITEEYRDGGVITTLNTPWHDGEESITKRPWTRWVEENLADLARLTQHAAAPATRSKKSKKSKRR